MLRLRYSGLTIDDIFYEGRKEKKNYCSVLMMDIYIKM